MRRRRLLAAALTLAAALLPAPVSADVRDDASDRPSVNRRLADPSIVEGSGLARSGRHPGVLYVVNDSGHGSQVYAVGADGGTRAKLTLAGAETHDWEALSSGPGHSLWVADIGDNAAERDEVTVYRVSEPASLRDRDVAWREYRLRYPDGAHDAEALLVHPRTGRVYVAAKSLDDPGLYAAPRSLDPGGKAALMRRVGTVPWYVTGGEFAPDGSRFVLRDPSTAYVYEVRDDVVAPTTSDARLVPLPRQKQGESAAWTADGTALLVGSEGAGSALWQVPLSGPFAQTAARAGARAGKPDRLDSRAAGPERQDSNEDGRPGVWRPSRLLVALVAGVVLAGLTWFRRRRRSRRR